MKYLCFNSSGPFAKILIQVWNDLKKARIVPILIIVVAFSIGVNIFVGDLAISSFSLDRWRGITIVACLFLLLSFLLDIFAAFPEIKNFKDPESGVINTRELWRKVYTNPVSGLILIVVITFGITSAQNLSEIYRLYAKTWHDAILWDLEASFFYALKGSFIDIPIFWDRIYFSYWIYLMLAYCTLYRLKRFSDLGILSIATVFSYFLTRLVALQYPTAGPAFYKPDLFNLSGTISDAAQKLLVIYMQGGVPQDGFIPGTMGMPSLHIGVAVMAAWFLARNIKWTTWLSVVWIVFIWISTVMLGWHYILDGVGGILLVVFAVSGARGIVRILRV